jgi:hypothetical protein
MRHIDLTPESPAVLLAAALMILPAEVASTVEELLQRNCAGCHSDKVSTSGFSLPSIR